MVGEQVRSTISSDALSGKVVPQQCPVLRSSDTDERSSQHLGPTIVISKVPRSFCKAIAMEITFKLNRYQTGRTIATIVGRHTCRTCDKYSLLLSTLVLSKKILSALSVLQLSWTTLRAVHRCSLRHGWACHM